MSVNSGLQIEQPKSTLPVLRQLRWNLILYFILLAVVPMALTVAFALNQAIGQTRDQIRNQLESIVELKQDQLIRWLNDSQAALDQFLSDSSRTSLLITLVESPTPTPPGQTDVSYRAIQISFNDQLYNAAMAQPLIEELFVYNVEGEIVTASNPVQIGKIVVRQPYFADSLSGDAIQTPYYEVGSGELTLFVTTPLMAQSGQVVGVLAARLDTETLAQIMTERTGLGDNGETYLVSLENNYLLTPSRFENEGYILTRAYHSDGIDRALQQQDGTAIYESYREVRVIGVFRWLPELQVAMLAEVDETEALVSSVRTRNITIGIAGLAALGAIIIGLYAAARISNPLSALTEVATQIAGGDLNQRARIKQQNEIGVLAVAFNRMTDQLRDLIGSLEQRVADRTRALETSGEISRQLTTILDLDELLRYVVNRIQKEFDFYHTHIYLIDEETEDLVMVEGSGEVGQQLKARGHRLQAGQGIVGTVASTNEHFLSNNVNEVLNFVRNPLLPDTNSELAVPLRKGEQVLGVLDIQSEKLNYFTPADVALMQSIANQTAIAIDNARLLAESQTTLREVERLNRRLTREGWHETVEGVATPGYRFIGGTRSKIAPVTDTWSAPMKQAALKKQLVKSKSAGNGDGQKVELAVPLLLRGEVIGVVDVKRDETLDWAAEEVAAVEAVANQVALALENARLSKEQEKTIGQLKEIDRLKSEFLTSMSHELRTPLNSIIGFADILLQGIDGELNDLAMNDIRLIYNSGQHLLALINDILDLAKIEGGLMELLREPVDISEIVQEIMTTSTTLVKDRPVEIIVNVPAGLSPINADKLRLKQILLNLVSNATKFTPEGSITISAKIQDDKPGEMFISVKDTGIGMKPKVQEIIFERFRQADASMTRQYGGTGLGLPICKQLVELHGGAIGVSSTEGVGSEFYFTIPLAEIVG